MARKAGGSPPARPGRRDTRRRNQPDGERREAAGDRKRRRHAGGEAVRDQVSESAVRCASGEGRSVTSKIANSPKCHEAEINLSFVRAPRSTESRQLIAESFSAKHQCASIKDVFSPGRSATAAPGCTRFAPGT